MRQIATALVMLTLIAMPVLAFSTADVLSLVAMPLAVAAVADLAGVPQDQLANFVATLNNANVPPVQFVEVLRYVPVALANENAQQFVGYVQDQYSQGVTGPALITTIDRQLPTYGLAQSEVTVLSLRTDRPITIDDKYFPPLVRERVARANHPHGGPPGQLKKELGLQTGAEVVHGYKPGREAGRVRKMAPTIVQQEQPAGGPPAGMPPGQAKKQGGGGKGHGHGHGKG